MVNEDNGRETKLVVANYLRFWLKIIGICLAAALPMGVVVLLNDQVPQRWKAASSLVLLSTLVLGLSWLMLIGSAAPELARRARTRLTITSSLLVACAVATGFMDDEAREGLIVIAMGLIVAGVGWATAAVRRWA